MKKMTLREIIQKLYISCFVTVMSCFGTSLNFLLPNHKSAVGYNYINELIHAWNWIMGISFQQLHNQF